MSIMEELASHGITYASYGGCKRTHAASHALASLSNQDWRRYGAESAGAELVAVATRHLFFYAAENSDYPFYITEKVKAVSPIGLFTLHFHRLSPPSTPVCR
jgi:hypothetical protein